MAERQTKHLVDLVDTDLLLRAQFNYDQPSYLISQGRIYVGFVPDSDTSEVVNLVIGQVDDSAVRPRMRIGSRGQGLVWRRSWYFRTFRAIPPPHEGADYTEFEKQARNVIGPNHRIRGADLRRLILEQLEVNQSSREESGEGWNDPN